MKYGINLIVLIFTLNLCSFTISDPTPRKQKIVIDAAFLNDENATEEYETEKEITEAIARKVKFLNSDKSIEIIIIRDKGEALTAVEKVKMINDLKPDLVISLHLNSDRDTTIRGIDALVGTENSNNEESKEIAEAIFQSTPKSYSKGEVKEINYFTLNNLNCPAILLELGYTSNSQDREYLNSQLGQQRIAETIVKTIKMK